MTTAALTDDANFRHGVQAEVVADSISPEGVRLTTFDTVHHRFILGEVNTHRALSRNGASSRAIPSAKKLRRALEYPAVPVSWGRNQPGMQAGEELDAADAAAAEAIWLEMRDAVADGVARLHELGVHKQVANRPLEPFEWQRTVITATDLDGFFAQRLHRDAQPEFEQLARAMREALDASTPLELAHGQWHTPFVLDDEADLDLDTRKRVAAARAARTSYLTHRGERSLDEDLALYERLCSAAPPHASPLEHVATPVDPDRTDWRDVPGNLTGWRQLRHDVFPTW